MSIKIFVWTPGGSGVGLSLGGAQEEVGRMLREQPEYMWEWREPGDMEYQDYPHLYPTLKQAIEHALPIYAALGLSLSAAGLLAMDAGLVLSTGILVDEQSSIMEE